ncbi:MAG: methylmalonyl-CoA decarboxylase [Deltaproteobacteria bacterium]|jgi:methylmalonyl-CoA decarboxylase|nr:methylmalonyl-CoA decarboxylase [Deltaproteobacteria bacterium]
MDFVNIQLNDKIATLTLSNPSKLNALSKGLVDELIQALQICSENKIIVVLLKAKENKNNVWSAGHDIHELPEGRRDPLSFFDAIEVLLHEVQGFSGPVIAVVRGSVWGAACDLIMTCDMVFADNTSSFAITPAKIGIPYNVTGIMHFINRVGLNRAKEMFFTANPVDAETAEDWGIINHLFPKDELDDKVFEIAKQICQNSPLAVGVIKEQFHYLSETCVSMPPVLFERISGLRRKVYDSHDYLEGIRAFKEKRKPTYLGE